MTEATFYEKYADCLAKLDRRVLGRGADILGLNSDGLAAIVPFYDQIYRVRPGKIVSLEGRKPTDAVGLVLCRYLSDAPAGSLPEGRPVSFREFKGAGPLVSSFASNTNKLITSAFASSIESLQRASRQLKGRIQADHPGYDLSVVFDALPRIPLCLQFNAADDLFPAQCSLLFEPSAETFLDMPSLFILGTYLAGRLVGHSAAA